MSKFYLFLLIIMWTFLPIYTIFTLIYESNSGLKLIGYNKIFISLIKNIP